MATHDIEYYKNMRNSSKKWLGLQATDLLEHYEKLEKQLNAIDHSLENFNAYDDTVLVYARQKDLLYLLRDIINIIKAGEKQDGIH